MCTMLIHVFPGEQWGVINKGIHRLKNTRWGRKHVMGCRKLNIGGCGGRKNNRI